MQKKETELEKKNIKDCGNANEKGDAREKRKKTKAMALKEEI